MKKLILTTLLSISATSAVYAQRCDFYGDDTTLFLSNAFGDNPSAYAKLFNVGESRDYILLAKISPKKYIFMMNEELLLDYEENKTLKDLKEGGIDHVVSSASGDKTLDIRIPVETEESNNKFSKEGRITVAKIKYSKSLDFDDPFQNNDVGAIERMKITDDMKQLLVIHNRGKANGEINCYTYDPSRGDSWQIQELSSEIKFNNPDHIGYIFCKTKGF